MVIKLFELSKSSGRILALDLGEKRIGIALSDETQIIAQPFSILMRSNRDKDIAAIAAIAKEREVVLIILGLPENSDGTLTSIGKKALTLGKRLARLTGIKVVYIDEFETTKKAQVALLEEKISRKKRQKVVDKLAASFILRRFLDSQGWEGSN